MDTKIKRIEKSLEAKFKNIEKAKTLWHFYLDVSAYAEYLERTPILWKAVEQLLEETRKSQSESRRLREEYKKFEDNLPKPASEEDEISRDRLRLRKLWSCIYAHQQDALDLEKEDFGAALRIMIVPTYVDQGKAADYRKLLKEHAEESQLKNFEEKRSIIAGLIHLHLDGEIERYKQKHRDEWLTDKNAVWRDVHRLHNYLLVYLEDLPGQIPPTASFDEETCVVRIDSKEVPLPKGKYEADVCKALFSDPTGEWDTIGIGDALGERKGDYKEPWRRPYNAVRRINDKVKKEAGKDVNLIVNPGGNKRLWQINPELLPSK